MSSKRSQDSKTNLGKNWQDWVSRSLLQGTKPIAIYNTMRKDGFSLNQIEAALGQRHPLIELDGFGRDKSERIVDYKAVSNCALTKIDRPEIRQIQTRKAQVYVWRDFLSPEECLSLIELTDSHLIDSEITGLQAQRDAGFRTSRTCFLDELDNPMVTVLSEKISNAMGLSLDWSEPNQAQKYEIDQEFKAHTDYFTPGGIQSVDEIRARGQRTWTFMIYLNDVEAGGATRFKKLEKTFKPVAGQALIWNSLTPEGDVNPWTVHHGMKVRKGHKYVITKWFRDKGNGPMTTPDHESTT